LAWRILRIKDDARGLGETGSTDNAVWAIYTGVGRRGKERLIDNRRGESKVLSEKRRQTTKKGGFQEKGNRGKKSANLEMRARILEKTMRPDSGQ
jgi:hypothetical protein